MTTVDFWHEWRAIFVITDVAADERGSLHNTFSIWDHDDRITPGHFWLLTYNAFSHSGLGKCMQIGWPARPTQ